MFSSLKDVIQHGQADTMVQIYPPSPHTQTHAHMYTHTHTSVMGGLGHEDDNSPEQTGQR